MQVTTVIENLKQRFPNQPEYIQAVSQVLATIEEEYNLHPEFESANLIERLCIPDRLVQFRVTWVDDQGHVQTNMGYRVQHNNAIGPYKGGLRFHASVNLSILKFLAFEQTFKNALTTLPMGGAKGGSDFSPRGKSDAEVMRFCQAFMTELYRHIGPDEDVPAGDIDVGGREVGYLFGMYKKLTHQFQGVLTGKGRDFGGSLIRPEATGYGNIYFLQNMLATRGIDLKGKTVAVLGYGIQGTEQNKAKLVDSGNRDRKNEIERQVEAACRAQPVAAGFPYNYKGPEKEVIAALCQQYNVKNYQPISNYGGFNRDSSDWSENNVFMFGLMSFLLPRYQFMLDGEENLYDSISHPNGPWAANNRRPYLLDGSRNYEWKDVQKWTHMGPEHYNDTSSADSDRRAMIESVPSQAVCARWMPNLAGIVGCQHAYSLFGVDIQSHRSGDTTLLDLKHPSGFEIFSPGGADSTGDQYVLDGATATVGSLTIGGMALPRGTYSGANGSGDKTYASAFGTGTGSVFVRGYRGLMILVN